MKHIVRKSETKFVHFKGKKEPHGLATEAQKQYMTDVGIPFMEKITSKVAAYKITKWQVRGKYTRLTGVPSDFDFNVANREIQRR